MKYVALLRGINIGGRNKINMQKLKDAATAAGLKEVSTYINSGNLFFTSHQPAEALRQKIEDFIQSEFALTIKVFIRNRQQIQGVAAVLPDSWCNNEKMRSDIIFLGDHCDDPSILKKITIQLEVDEVRYVSGALLWRADRLSLNRSGLMKLAATEVYPSMTIRNCNTFRKIAELMS